MANITLAQAVNQALREEMRRDDRVIVLGEDIGKRGGVFLCTEGLYEEFGPERVIDTPLSESAIIGAALGMA
ncbi:MAG TPA: alpha-ketoacid dehydrogenase subunit beta, partial [Aigarchaeota archaeon]|nr:alpha-ketoacid dehydrogenase subunit beta [Aigarchaeota archaeon]